MPCWVTSYKTENKYRDKILDNAKCQNLSIDKILSSKVQGSGLVMVGKVNEITL